MTNTSSVASYLESMFSLEGEVALITGASSGIGAHIAKCLAKAGAKTILGARRTDRIDSLAQEIEAETGRTSIAVALDVTSSDSVKAAFETAVREIGVPTIVCNNAGVGVGKWALDDTEEDYDFTMDTNQKGVWRVAQTAARHLREAGKPGSIINTASILGLGVGPQYTTYATSKAAVVQMTKVMAIEFQRFGVRVNAVCPGYFKTEINDTFLETDHGQEMLKRTPAGREGHLDELATAFLMLASPKSTFTSGVALPVDAGHNVVLV